MKMRFSIVLLIVLLFGSATHSHAQKNKDPKLASGKNLRNTIINMLRTAKEIKTPPQTCDASGLLKSIPRSKLVPTKEELKSDIIKIVDSLKPTLREQDEWPEILDHYNTSKDFFEFHRKVTGSDIGTVIPSVQKKVRTYYNRLKNSLKNGFDLKKVEFQHKKCKVVALTNLKPSGWSINKKKNPPTITVNWEITTNVTISCDCKKQNKFRVKDVKYFYSGKSSSRLLFDEFVDSGPLSGTIIFRFGLRFGKIKESKYGRSKLVCCPKNSTTEDGSYINPDEDINNDTPFIDVSAGTSFGSEEETEVIGFFGYFFKVANIGNIPLFVGPKVTVNTTELNGNDFIATRVLIGPSAEYKIPVGNGKTRILTGVNAGYSFGNINAFGFKQTSSGFAINTYAGAEFGLGSNLGLGVQLNFFEYNNTTFKADEGGFKSSSSNTILLTDRAGITVGLRIGVD